MSETLGVAMIIQSYLPRLGGAERQLAALAPLLAELNVEVHVLTRRYPGLAPFELINDVPVYRLPVPGPKPVASLVFTLSAMPLLRRLRPHVIHAHELLSPTTTAVAAKRFFDIPVVAKVLRGGTLGDLTKLRRKPFAQRRLSAFKEQVDAFIVISREIDRELAQAGVPPRQRIFIPNGVDTTRFSPPSNKKKEALRASLDLTGGLVALFVGRLVPEKRADQLVAIWPSIRTRHPGAHLLLLGTGPEETRLKRLAGAGVRFVGYVDDVRAYLQVADLFVLPSATEGLSNALLEALAAGVPTVATAVGGAPDVVEHGKSGWLVPPDDSAALQNAILMVLDDTALRTKLARDGRQQVRRNYALPVTAQRLRALYDHLVTGQPVSVPGHTLA